MDLEVDRRGKAFEAETAAAFTRAEWSTHPSIPMKRIGAPKALGEIDVLAISPDGNTWVLCECKWFGAARTPREVAGWMQDFHGRGGDKLDKHLSRLRWIQAEVSSVAQRLGLTVPTTILPLIVTTRPVPLAFVQELPKGADVRTIQQLRAELSNWEAGRKH
ncbi:hypothetical protein [Phenylobacterium sp.]|uniref:hypothetical protein n=1 Tax=Phenylobacterium sp. TaxID=1871053 RepID=UPI00289B5C3E|nr:hypothetical protein [Phenylobacterium sp.]